jgi:hypothetical protein
MPNPDHLAILETGVSHWNAWRRENPGVAIDLSGAILHETRAPWHSGQLGCPNRLLDDL